MAVGAIGLSPENAAVYQKIAPGSADVQAANIGSRPPENTTDVTNRALSARSPVSASAVAETSRATLLGKMGIGNHVNIAA